MAAYSWTKLKCANCGKVERVRGKHFTASFCTWCHGPGTPQVWTELHCGPEKYALPYGGKGAIYRNARWPSP